MSASPNPLDAAEPAVRALAEALVARGLTLATAESCTGGLIAAACTAVAGSSAWFERGVVTYSNEAKTALLGVPPPTIARHGAVSAEVARAMAEGTLAHTPAALALAVSGVAGPGGGSPDKPVGTVWLGVALRGGASTVHQLQLDGDRAAIRLQTVLQALAAGQAALG